MIVQKLYHDEFYSHPQTKEMQQLNLLHFKESKQSAFVKDFEAKRPGVMFVAFREDYPIGICCITMDHKMRLQLGMFTHPEHRKQGVASAIWEHVIEFHSRVNKTLRAAHWGKGKQFFSKRGILDSCLYYESSLDKDVLQKQIAFLNQISLKQL